MRRKRRRGVDKRRDLMDDVWKQMSMVVRREEKGVCFTCGKKAYWKEMQGGHYQHGMYKKTYFMRKNVHCQCGRCNGPLHGQLDIYGFKLDELYGEGTARELYDLAQEEYRWKMSELEELLNTYKQRNEELDDEYL